MSTWIRSYENAKTGEYLEHLNGVDWYDAPGVPLWQRPFHRHAPQTRGRMSGDYVERCRCGASRFDGDSGIWLGAS